MSSSVWVHTHWISTDLDGRACEKMVPWILAHGNISWDMKTMVLEDKTSTWNMKIKKDNPWKNPRSWRDKSKKEKVKSARKVQEGGVEGYKRKTSLSFIHHIITSSYPLV